MTVTDMPVAATVPSLATAHPAVWAALLQMRASGDCDVFAITLAGLTGLTGQHLLGMHRKGWLHATNAVTDGPAGLNELEDLDNVVLLRLTVEGRDVADQVDRQNRTLLYLAGRLLGRARIGTVLRLIGSARDDLLDLEDRRLIRIDRRDRRSFDQDVTVIAPAGRALAVAPYNNVYRLAAAA
jgi:hypothetical protein